MSVTIKIPYLATVWATGSFGNEHSNPDWIIPGRKMTRLPAPFYKRVVGEFEIDTIDENNVEFDITTERDKKHFCLDADGEFYLRELGFLNGNLYSGKMNLSTTEAIPLLERNNILDDKQVMISVSKECKTPTHILSNVRNATFYRPGRMTGFLASVDDLGANAVIIDECDDRFKDIQAELKKYAYHNGRFWHKTKEPMIAHITKAIVSHSQIICDQEYHQNLWNMIMNQVFDFALPNTSVHGKKLMDYVEATGNRLGIELHSIWQDEGKKYLSEITGNADLLNASDNRDLCKMALKMYSECSNPATTKYSSVAKEMMKNPIIVGDATSVIKFG